MLPLMSTRNGHRDGRLPIGPEVDDRPELSVVPDFKVCAPEPLHNAPARVADGGLYRHEVDRAPKNLWGCRGRLSAQPRHRDGIQDRHGERHPRTRGHHDFCIGRLTGWHEPHRGATIL